MLLEKMNKKILIIIALVIMVFTVSCNFSTIIDAASGPTIEIEGEATVYVGESFQAKAVVKPIEKYSQEVTWKSNNDTIATVTDGGLVTGVSVGRVSIVATSKENNESIGKLYLKVVQKDIIYTDDAPTEIKLTGKKAVHVGTIGLYRAQTVPANASQKLTWISSNEEVATVNSIGIVNFKKSGEVVITCQSAIDNNVKETILVNVSESIRDEDEEQAIINMIANTKNSILGVANYQYNSNQVLVKNSVGSGFVYDAWGYLEDGSITYDLNNEAIVKYGYYLITNRHVVKDSDELKIYIHMIDEEIPASLIQYDEKVDMAVVEFNYEEYIQPLELVNSDNLQAGQYCIAIGNPEGFMYSSSATMGIISYPLRYISDDTDGDGVNDWDAAYIQHDAAINPGNSGGPLLNLYGQVIGINTMKFASTDIDNMGFSIPSKDILDLLPYLEKGEVPVRAKIGVTVIAISDLLQTDYKSAEYKYIIPEGQKIGIYVTDVSEGSVAYGKLQADDIIIEFNGVKLKTSLQLRAELGAIVVGSNTSIEVKALRDGKEITVTLIW